MDFTRTNNPTSLTKAAGIHPFPEWADSAPIPHADGLVGFSNSIFADTHRRLLPLHTKEAAFFSAIDFLDHPEDFGLEAGERVKKACDGFGIWGEMLPWLHASANSFEKSASSCSWAIDTEIGGTPIRMFPLDTDENVREAVYGLTKMAQEKRIEYTMLREAALNVMEKDADAANELLAAFAITQFTDPEKTAALISSRGGDDAQQKAYNTIAKELAEGLDPETAVIKLAACDIAFDKPNHPFPTTRLRPHELVYCGDKLSDLRKEASQHVFVMEVLIPRSALAAIDPTDIEYALSKQAGVAFDAQRLDLEDVVAGWDKYDQKALLHLALHV